MITVLCAYFWICHFAGGYFIPWFCFLFGFFRECAVCCLLSSYIELVFSQELAIFSGIACYWRLGYWVSLAKNVEREFLCYPLRMMSERKWKTHLVCSNRVGDEKGGIGLQDH